MNYSTTDPYYPENPEDYASWVAKHGLVAPYGKCQCQCGEDAPIAKENRRDRGFMKGKPTRYIPGHSSAVGNASLAQRLSVYCPKSNPDECWLWQGPVNRDGYGQSTFASQYFLAHRVAYELAYGPIPDGLQVCHHCDQPACCNPAHLFLGTSADNTADKISKNRHQRGEQVVNAKLAEQDVLEILDLLRNGMSQIRVSLKFCVSQTTIHQIVYGRAWAHIGDRANLIDKRGMPRGHRHHNARLTENDVRKIRCLRQEGKRVKEIANQFNISKDYVYTIVSRKAWRHIE